MDRRYLRKGGFTLVELLIVIGVIVTLMGLIVTIGPLVSEMLKERQAEINLNLLKQALINYKEVFLPEDTKYENDVANNDHLVEALNIDKELVKDPWGEDVYYDNLKDEDGKPDINHNLPRNPIAAEFPSSELSEEDEIKLDRWDFVIWMLKPVDDDEDYNAKRDIIQRRGKKIR